jgi:peptidoglycan/xylan/chitin deacetylase (PgdA/CDA1 family)
MRIVALTFHDVVADGRSASAESDTFYRIKASEFESLLSQLRKLSYQTVSSRHFRAWQQGWRNLPERTVVLTFDDGYASHFELVAPLLVRYRFIGTFFVTTGFIGKPGYMSWGQLRKLIFLGMEIGSHGASHQPLTPLSPHELAEEVVSSKRLLEERLGVPIQAMAAPGGSWNPAVAEASKQAGYEAVWVSTIGTNGKETLPMALRRVVVRRPFSAERVVSMVEGWQPSFWWVANQQMLIRLLKRALGVYWYEQLKRRLVPNA